jgi:nucleotide-binding universal stress UspA family protein
VTHEAVVKRILAAVDNSTRAADVFQAAAELGAALGATVHVFRAAYLAPELPPAAATLPSTLEADLAARVTKDLESLVLGTGAVVEPPTVSARAAWREVLDVARHLDADLIVVGSHGYGGWDRVLGTNAARIADHSDCSVLVVHKKR